MGPRVSRAGGGGAGQILAFLGRLGVTACPMRKLIILIAGALVATAALAQGDAGRQFGHVVGLPSIWPSPHDAGNSASNKPDAGSLSIQW